MKKAPKDLTAEQARQAIRLSSALRSAIQTVMEMSDKEVLDNGITEKERMQAVNALSSAYCQIDEPSRNRFDLNMSTLLTPFEESRRAEIQTVVGSISSTLCQFVAQPWGVIQDAFDVAGVKCPLVLVKFHSAYQEKIRTSSGMPPEAPPSCCGRCADSL